MTTALLILVGSIVSGVGLASVAAFERSSRMRLRPDRPELAPPRAPWGGGPLHPPSRAATARALAGFARLVRRRTRVVDHRRGLRRLSRLLGCGALLLGLAMLPIAGTWGGAGGPPLLLLDLEGGLIAILLVLLAMAFARIATGLSERSAWSRMGSARQASRAIAGTALLVLASMPLAIDAASLRLHDLVLDQQQMLWPVAGAARLFGPEVVARLEAWPIPAWNLFTQPLTALLFAAAISLWVSSPRADVPAAGLVGVAGLGLDGDATELYWIRAESRLAVVFAGGLFVTLFLGAGGLPLLDPVALVELAAPFFGRGLPEAVLTGLHVGVFVGKLVVVLFLASRVARMTAASRDDRSLRLATRRLLPVAWANLLLVTAIALWLDGLGGVGA
ncbi:MAG: NADH-quinone oxidoreductase subunit H [Myxococcota bacterium]